MQLPTPCLPVVAPQLPSHRSLLSSVAPELPHEAHGICLPPCLSSLANLKERLFHFVVFLIVAFDKSLVVTMASSSLLPGLADNSPTFSMVPCLIQVQPRPRAMEL
ncbi:uncharacterized protein LOC123448302 [Hordeum vulgare subsp. vulgare]|uniref:uncharacterized protein LOC123448302 n=1 Tax=Hordeum vulgare subsp. vulgare TaxID=112509 RepID=UPI00162C3007|nr:uncharacterized protein LOC123448302 [Hordeum vulgare subsp. vulgare]